MKGDGALYFPANLKSSYVRNKEGENEETPSLSDDNRERL
jgi:hypothetical protein